MGSTPIYALPYPEATDPADVPTDMRELAEKAELTLDGLDDRLDVLDAGIGNALNHGCRVHRANAQALAAAAETRVFFDSESWDPSNSYSEANSFIAPATGLYSWASSIALIGLATGARAALLMKVNGVERDRGADVSNATGANPLGLTGSGIVRLNAGESLTIVIYSGGACNLDVGFSPQSRQYLEIARLA